MNSNHKSRRLSRSTHRRSSPCVPIAVAAAAALVAALAGCGGPASRTAAQADDKASSKAPDTGVRLLWLGDSIAGAEAPALGAALEASGVDFKDASSDGGGTVVAGSEKITKMIAADTWKQLAKNAESFRPTVVAYQITTYDWGSAGQQRAAYERLVRTARAAGAKTVLIPAPPIKIGDFYEKHAPQMRTAPQAAKAVARNSGGAAVFLDASRLWGTDASARKAQRASDGIHNCQQGAAAFAAWFAAALGKQEDVTPAAVDTWANGSWTGNERYSMLKCED